MDWLYERQDHIEEQLAARHLGGSAQSIIDRRAFDAYLMMPSLT